MQQMDKRMAMWRRVGGIFGLIQNTDLCYYTNYIQFHQIKTSASRTLKLTVFRQAGTVCGLVQGVLYQLSYYIIQIEHCTQLWLWQLIGPRIMKPQSETKRITRRLMKSWKTLTDSVTPKQKLS